MQFLERKARTEEEFFHTFNALHDGGPPDRPHLRPAAARPAARSKTACASASSPGSSPTSARRISPRASRSCASASHHDDVHVADHDALGVIAERIRTNVRALEGALIRVVAYSSLTGRPITCELAEEVLSGLYPQAPTGEPHTCTVAEIKDAACAHFALSPEELLSSSRSPRLAWPRQLAMYLARELSGESLPAIGRQFGGRDHTTVLYAWRKASARLASDHDARDAAETLRATLTRPST